MYQYHHNSSGSLHAEKHLNHSSEHQTKAYSNQELEELRNSKESRRVHFASKQN